MSAYQYITKNYNIFKFLRRRKLQHSIFLTNWTKRDGEAKEVAAISAKCLIGRGTDPLVPTWVTDIYCFPLPCFVRANVWSYKINGQTSTNPIHYIKINCLVLYIPSLVGGADIIRGRGRCWLHSPLTHLAYDDVWLTTIWQLSCNVVLARQGRP